MLGFRKKIGFLFYFYLPPYRLEQKWSGKDPGNYKSIKGRLIAMKYEIRLC